MNKGGIIVDGTEVPFFDGYIIKNGSAVKIYDGYVIKDGQAVKIYQNEITWTTIFTLTNQLFSTGITYGNDEIVSLFGETESTSDGGGITVEGIYTFTDPFFMRAGQTLSFNSAGSGAFNIAINNQDYVDITSAPYTFATDTEIQKISLRGLYYHESTESGAIYFNLRVAVNSDYGSFILNNTNTSAQS